MFRLDRNGADRKRLMQQHHLTKRQTIGRACTLEHLRPEGDPLRNHPDSLAGACADCNSRRPHSVSWVEFATIRQEKFR